MLCWEEAVDSMCARPCTFVSHGPVSWVPLPSKFYGAEWATYERPHRESQGSDPELGSLAQDLNHHVKLPLCAQMGPA